MGKRRTFTAGYKAEVVKMVTDSGKSARTIACDLGRGARPLRGLTPKRTYSTTRPSW